MDRHPFDPQKARDAAADLAYPIHHYDLPICCLHCGAPLVHRASGVTTGTMTRAIADCPECSREHRVTVLLQVIEKGSGKAPYPPRKKKVA